jgi:hypothetical protein
MMFAGDSLSTPTHDRSARVARAGSSHEVTSTTTGALVYLRGAPDCNAAA